VGGIPYVGEHFFLLQESYSPLRFNTHILK
jgi:hypothetical protein